MPATVQVIQASEADQECGCSSMDRVLASEAKGCGFDPRQPHHQKIIVSHLHYAVARQLQRAQAGAFLGYGMVRPCAMGTYSRYIKDGLYQASGIEVNGRADERGVLA